MSCWENQSEHIPGARKNIFISMGGEEEKIEKKLSVRKTKTSQLTFLL